MRLIDAELLEEQFGISDADILAKEEIRFAPTVDAVPVVHGHRVDDGGFYARCSQCDGVLPICANYCPNCGAKMDGKRKDGGDG
jgi:hypothetical protein